MNDHRKEELLTRWMDDALSDEELAELEPLLQEHPELREERASYARIREELQSAIPAEEEPPYPEFFNAHLERLVREASRDDRSRRARGGALSKLWLWWMAPAATAAIVAAFLLGMKSARPDQLDLADSAAGSGVYSPLVNVSTEVIFDKESETTLLVVEGLEPLTDSDLLIGVGANEGEHGFFVNTREVY